MPLFQELWIIEPIFCFPGLFKIWHFYPLSLFSPLIISQSLGAADVNIDKIQLECVTQLASDLENHGDVDLSKLFNCGRVIETIDQDKIFVSSFDIDTLLSIIPFSPIVYVQICPRCVNSTDLNVFAKLAKFGLIVPILIAPYRMYEDCVVEQVIKYDHISVYEFDLYRRISFFNK